MRKKYNRLRHWKHQKNKLHWHINTAQIKCNSTSGIQLKFDAKIQGKKCKKKQNSTRFTISLCLSLWLCLCLNLSLIRWGCVRWFNVSHGLCSCALDQPMKQVSTLAYEGSICCPTRERLQLWGRIIAPPTCAWNKRCLHNKEKILETCKKTNSKIKWV